MTYNVFGGILNIAQLNYINRLLSVMMIDYRMYTVVCLLQCLVISMQFHEIWPQFRPDLNMHDLFVKIKSGAALLIVVFKIPGSYSTWTFCVCYKNHCNIQPWAYVRTYTVSLVPSLQ